MVSDDIKRGLIRVLKLDLVDEPHAVISRFERPLPALRMAKVPVTPLYRHLDCVVCVFGGERCLETV